MNHMKDKKSKAKRTVSGVITVEMTYIVPMIFFIFVMIIYTVFYYHDKNILIGTAAETAVIGAQLERKPNQRGEADLTEVYRQRIYGKLILFPEAMAVCEITNTKVTVTIKAVWKKMELEVEQSAPLLHPERIIRDKKIINGITEE